MKRLLLGMTALMIALPLFTQTATADGSKKSDEQRMEDTQAVPGSTQTPSTGTTNDAQMQEDSTIDSSSDVEMQEDSTMDSTIDSPGQAEDLDTVEE